MKSSQEVEARQEGKNEVKSRRQEWIEEMNEEWRSQEMNEELKKPRMNEEMKKWRMNEELKKSRWIEEMNEEWRSQELKKPRRIKEVKMNRRNEARMN